MDFFAEVFAWLIDSQQWEGPNGIPLRLLEHIGYSLAACGAAVVIGLPVGLLVGHTGRGAALAINIANLGRAIPTFGIIVLMVMLLGLGFIPPFVALVAFAIPPVLTNAYAGVQSVESEIRDAAEGMGMRPMQVLREVELPVAMPLIMAGVRTAGVQTIATATLAAYVGLGGLGRYIINGLAVQDFVRVTAGAVLVAALALIVEGVLASLQRASTPRGLRQAAAHAKVTARAKASATA